MQHQSRQYAIAPILHTQAADWKLWFENECGYTGLISLAGENQIKATPPKPFRRLTSATPMCWRQQQTLNRNPNWRFALNAKSISVPD
jgi:hypothetical protein